METDTGKFLFIVGVGLVTLLLVTMSVEIGVNYGRERYEEELANKHYGEMTVTNDRKVVFRLCTHEEIVNNYNQNKK